MKAYINAGIFAGVMDGVQQGSNLKPLITGEETFKIPSEGVFYVPVSATTNWSMRRTGGTPVAALSTVDVTGDDAVRFKANKVLKFESGATGTSSNQVRYTFQAGEKPANIESYNFLIWVKLDEGDEITAWNTATEIDFLLLKDNSNFFRYVIGINSVEYASAGWYAFSVTTSYARETVGTLTFADITQIGLQVNKALANAPILQIGMIAVVPKPAKAQVLFMFDGQYESQKAIADLLTANNMTASFFVDGVNVGFTLPEMLSRQANGHLFAAYCRNYATDPINILTTTQAFLTENGLTGKRHFVHGIASTNTESLWSAIIPAKADSMGYSMRTLTSQYHRKYNGRYNPVAQFDKATSITIVNAAVTDCAKVGFLLHAVEGSYMTDLTDFVVNTLKPLQDAGTIEVINVKQAFDKTKLI